MNSYLKTISLALVLAAIPVLIGCGQKSSDNQTAASINGQDNSAAKSKTSNPTQSDDNLKFTKVIIDTSLGAITVRLDKIKAPLTVENFLEYAESGSYNHTIFHQVYKGQAVLAGGYTANMTEIRHGLPVSNEAHNGLKNLRGTIAMLRRTDEINSAESQFFINLVDNPELDHRDRTPEGYGYCVFGEVISVSDMNVVEQIANVPVKDTELIDQTPEQPVIVKSIRQVK
jgi:cyclophilin family peptidyl-prolyl cis-trans isomerase